jgi:hypothetical protein
VSAPPPVGEQSDDVIHRIHGGTHTENEYKCKKGEHLKLKLCLHGLSFTVSKRMEIAKNGQKK